ncbi:MAG: hypothetical protein VX501_09340 [Pseudomonadota bacterium]|nr:hypothetical protein [Pseudomonadota bacterium]
MDSPLLKGLMHEIGLWRPGSRADGRVQRLQKFARSGKLLFSGGVAMPRLAFSALVFRTAKAAKNT